MSADLQSSGGTLTPAQPPAPPPAPPLPPLPAGARWITRDGLRLAVDAQDSLGLAGPQAFEPDVAAALRRWAVPGATVVDIGANVGWFTLLLARCVGPSGRVHAFEPEPGNHALLLHNLQANPAVAGDGRVQAHALALGEQPGQAQLHTTAFNGGMHRLYDSVCCEGPAVTVPVARLDDLLPSGSVALVKIDVEGYEHPVLRGARALLATVPRPRVVSEYCPASMLEAGASPTAFLQDLAAWGLRPHDLQGRPVPLPELLADAERYDRWGRERFVAACAGRSNPEINDIVVALARQLGCTRPIIENLLFADAVDV